MADQPRSLRRMQEELGIAPKRRPLVAALIGCDWGRYVGLPDDPEPCHDQATRRITIYYGDSELEVQLCPKHTSMVLEQTTPHQE